VAMLMLCILLLALGDAIRTHHQRARRLSEARRRQSNQLGR
jgi:hypothetical protein